MKFPARLAAFLSAFTLLTGFSAPSYAAAAQPLSPQLSENTVYSSTDDAAAEIRECLKNRENVFSIILDNLAYPKETVSQTMLYKAFDETGSGSEGDYLRFSVKKFTCKIYISNYRYRLDYNIDYYTTTDEETLLSEKINGILSSLNTEGLSDYNKALLIYRYAVSNISYSADTSEPYAYTAYGAVMNRSAVCQGVTQLLYRLYNDSGIPCRIIAGVARDPQNSENENSHVWLITKIDGKYYLSDPTWDLSAKNGDFRYFLKGSSTFDDGTHKDHIPQNDNGRTFPDYNSEEFLSAYPVFESDAAEPGCTLGDLDGNSKINAVDASLILSEYSRRALIGVSSLTNSQKQCADLNSDNTINAVDASFVLSYYAHISCGGEGTIENFIKRGV